MADQEQFGDTNDEVRRNRLERLCKAVGGLQAAAAAVDTHWQYLDQILKRRPLKPRQDGTRAVAAMGDDLARRLEAAYGLQPGWMDWPFDAVPFDAWVRLGPLDRGYVQNAMRQAIKERLGDVPTETILNSVAESSALTRRDEAGADQFPEDTTVTQRNRKVAGQAPTVGPALERALVVGRRTKNGSQRDGREPAAVQKPRTRRRV